MALSRGNRSSRAKTDEPALRWNNVGPKIPANSNLKVKAPQKSIPKPAPKPAAPRSPSALLVKRGSLQGILKGRATPRTVVPAPAAPRTQPLPIGARAASPRRRFHFDGLHAATVAIAVVLAVISAYFSVKGMEHIFSGEGGMIKLMAGTMEAGKVAAAAWLSRYWQGMQVWVRGALTLLVVSIALINAVGVFGQLSAAHLNPHTIATSAVSEQAAVNAHAIDSQEYVVKDLERQIAQIDSAIEESTKRGRATAAMTLSEAQKKNRQDLAARHGTEGLRLQGLQQRRAQIEGEQNRIEGDVGVLQYAAELLHMPREQVIQLLILMMVMSCDPLSILLVVATAYRRPV